MPPENTPFDFFNDLTEQQQNSFLEEYLTKTTRYLTRFEFSRSPGCYYFLPEFVDDAHHQNSISNLAVLLLLLLKRDFLVPFRFKNDIRTNPFTGTPIVYYFFSNWPIANLHDMDFEAIQLIQDEELAQYAKTLEN